MRLRDTLLELLSVCGAGFVFVLLLTGGLILFDLANRVSPAPLGLASVIRDGPQSNKVLRVQFRSDTNLRRFAQMKHAGSLFLNFRFCSAKGMSESSEILHNRVSVTTFGGDNRPEVMAENAHMNDPGPFEYEALFTYRGDCVKVGNDECGRRVSLPCRPPTMCAWTYTT